MFQLLLLAAAPLVGSAWGNQDQKPLLDVTPDVLKLALDDDLRYRAQPSSSLEDMPTLLELSHLSHLAKSSSKPLRRSVVSIAIPMDPAVPAEVVIGASDNDREGDSASWETSEPGRNIPFSSAAVRREGQIMMDVQSTNLQLETPFITLPEEIHMVLVAATKPVRTSRALGTGYDDVVDCTRTSVFPDIVLGYAPSENENGEVEQEELVITPKQYVLSTENDECVLLVQAGEEVGLGWAAVRGQTVWLDFERGETGLEF